MRPSVKAVFVALVAASVSLSAAVTSPAWAQKKPVVVELFKGPNAEKVRLAVVRALLKQRIEVVPIKRLAMVEADLGLIRASDNYGAVSRELKNSAFVSGTVTPGRRPRVRIVVRSADGAVVGQTPFMGMNMARLIRNIGQGGGTRLAALIGNARGGPGDRGRAVPPVFSPAPAPPVVAETEPEAEPPPPARAETRAPGRQGAGRATGANADVEAESPPAVRKPVAGKVSGTGLNFAFMMRMFSRNFSYNQNARGGQQGYQAPEQKYNNLPLVPAPGLAIEYFPVPYLGVNGAYNRAIAGSKDAGGSVYKTTAFDWSINAKGRLDLLGLQVEPVLGYVAKTFEIENFADDPSRIQVAPVAYQHARVGVGVRMPLASGSAISAGGAYLHTLGAGEILNDVSYFGGKALAGEVYAAMTLPVGFVKGFDLRLGADFRRIAFAFTADLEAPRIAGGAVDQYIGVNLGIGYNLGP
jgi:hypothetical protein